MFRRRASSAKVRRWRKKKAKKSPGKAQIVVSRMPNAFGLPDQIKTRLRYGDLYTNLSTAGALDQQVWRMNSLFDPDFSGGGHQPMGFDQLATWYNQYAVISSKITIKPHGDSIANVPRYGGLALGDDTSFSSTHTELMEQSRDQTITIGNWSSGPAWRELSGTFSAKINLGIDPEASQTYKTLVTTNPSEGYAACFWSQPMDQLTTSSVYYTAEIEFYVLFTELKDLSGS